MSEYNNNDKFRSSAAIAAPYWNSREATEQRQDRRIVVLGTTQPSSGLPITRDFWPLMDHTESELESFRQKWRQEVLARGTNRGVSFKERSKSRKEGGSGGTGTKKPAAPLPHSEQIKFQNEDEVTDAYKSGDYHDLEDVETYKKLAHSGSQTRHRNNEEPKSALEHYERAVERESQGNLGDSVNLYRKAFKLDSRVHEAYKTKHFPPSSFPTLKPTNPNPSNASVTVPNPAHHSLHGLSSSVSELIAEFSKLSIPSAPPETDLSPQPPCPIAAVPEELLAEILLQVALLDVASFAHLAHVCKRFAYLVMTEERIWKRIALGSEFGFGAMHYSYACNLLGDPVDDNIDQDLGIGAAPLVALHDKSVPAPPASLSFSFLSRTTSLLHSKYASSYRQMFRGRPRLRFSGCYISTVNYTRPGAASNSSFFTTSSSPIHIVTYYRYLRFFRDGSCISLLTTAEPVDVVHHLAKENVHQHHSGGLPTAVMNDALRGRWRVSGGVPEEAEGDVHVETEGVIPKYMWKMQFLLCSAGRGARNNKLNWKGFWSYNKLTDDWGEFGLKNDKAFYWSRVKSYGMGY